MIWTFPAALYFAAVLLPVAAVFLYRRTFPVQDVPSIELWNRIGRPVVARSMATWLRQLLSLLVQVLIIVLLLAALGNPRPAKSVMRTVIVVDASYTMATRDEAGSTRLARALQLARDAARTFADGEVALVIAGADADLAQAPTRDLSAVRTKIESLTTQSVTADLPEAVSFSGRLLGDASIGRVIVVSDFASTTPGNIRAVWGRSQALTLLRVGRPAANAMVSSVWTEAQRGVFRVGCVVSHQGLDGKPATLTLTAGEQQLESQQITLKGTAQRFDFSADVPWGSSFKVQIDAQDLLADDDRAFGVAQAFSARICLVTRGNPLLQAAVEAGEPADLQVIPPAAFSGSQDADVVIVDADLPAAATPGEAGYLFLGHADPFGWLAFGETLDPGPVTHWSADHPFVAGVDPSTFVAKAANAAKWRAGLKVTELVNAGSRPLIVDVSDPASPRTGRRMFWLFDSGSSNLPTHGLYPVMLWNAIDHLAGDRKPGGPYWAGQTVRVPLHAQVTTPPRVTGPDAGNVAITLAADAWTFRPLQHGLYRVATPGEPEQTIAVNLLASPLTPGTTSEAGDDAASLIAPSHTSWARYLTWQYLLLAACIAAGVEGLLYARGWLRLGDQ